MIMVNLIGLLLIALIVWWFWLYKPQTKFVAYNDVIVEVKDGVYSPSLIQAPANKPFKLQFRRKDQSPCAETLLFPSLGISEQLKLNDITEISLNDLTKGEYEFHCQMKMYRGVLKVT